MNSHFRTVCVLLIFLFVFCRNHPQKGITLTFWHSFVATTHPALAELINRFEQEHPGLRIHAQYVPTGDALVQKLITAIQSHTAPDIAWVHADFLDRLCSARAIFPMNQFIHGTDSLSRKDGDDIFPALLQSASWRDTLFALPMEATTLALLYNRSSFRDAGLDPGHPPQTWEELRSFAQKLTIDSDNDNRKERYGFYVPVFPASGDLSIWMVLQWTPFLWQAGGEEKNSAGNVLYNSAAGVQALTLWKTLYQEIGLESLSLSHDVAFASGTVAMILDGPWNVPRYEKTAGLDWAVAPLPSGPVCAATYLEGEHLVIFKQTNHPQQAWSFLKWLINPDVQAFFSMQSAYLPVRASVLNQPEYRQFLAAHPNRKAFVEQIAISRARGLTDFNRVQVNQALAEAVEKAIIGDMDVATVLDEATIKANRLLKKSD
jgi:multiple sugar transport system substrate-binding protein